MSIDKKLFGKLDDGKEIYVYTLSSENITAKIINYGATIVELFVPDRNGKMADVVGGYDSLDSYVRADGYQGAVIGRYGNRIANGLFTLEGKEYHLAINNGPNHLHGGIFGFNTKVFDVELVEGKCPALVMRTVSYDGEENYPGNLELTVTYTLTKEGGISIRYEATTDKTTILNLTNHSYFNLGGYDSGSVLDHYLQLDADTYLPTNENLIPTGEMRSVEETPFDFRTSKQIGKDFFEDNTDLKLAGGYDHCFNFVGGESSDILKRGELYDEISGRLMELYTNQPCAQIYTGNFLTNAEFPFKNGVAQKPQSFVCLETEHMPDSINHEGFTDCVLKPGEKYDYTTEYRFSTK